MQHDIVFIVDEHEPCEETGYCKRCGIHIGQCEEMGWACRFATNTIAVTHIRAAQINDERHRDAMQRTMEYVEKVRAKLSKEEEEIITAIEEYSERWKDDK